MIFGLEQVKNLEYAAQSVVRMVKFGFIERFDVYGIAVMVLGCVIRMSTFQIVLNNGIRQWLGLKKKSGRCIWQSQLRCSLSPLQALKIIAISTIFTLQRFTRYRRQSLWQFQY